jgi:hypothetical protein
VSLYGSLLSPELAFHPSAPDPLKSFVFRNFGTLFTLGGWRTRDPTAISWVPYPFPGCAKGWDFSRFFQD